MEITVQVLYQLVTLATGCIGIYLAFATRKKTESEATKQITSAAQDVVTMQHGELDRMEVAVVYLEHYVEYLLTGIETLVLQLENHEIRPHFNPISYIAFKNKTKNTPE